MASSASIPVATGSAVRWMTGVASGNRCSMRARMAALRSDMALLEYPEHIPKARRVLGHRAGLAELARSLKTVGRSFLERSLNRPRDRGWNVTTEILQPRRWLGQICGQYGLG